ncbi:related to PRM1 - Pheromone-regulated multispanning membrane protein [Ustilago trichophora]|uniref:Plasma membrane fusion protein PRM1 n=1 Tax=Ustilago trichophora TaxID=86804 RepID=A0A5C3EAY2_9BASI|nr:related to PRM1 - Pheromone-regulated multispanning membrane protein [Ustilago trichophora]
MPAQSSIDPPPSYLQQPHQIAPSPPYAQNNFPRMPSPARSTLQPWLGLRARLFLSPISIPLISLLFVAFRLLTSSQDVNDSIASTKVRLLSACDAVEGTASLAASFPHFLASSTNVQLAESVNATVHGAARVFELSITAIEKILTYIVDSYRSLFLCFMELLVRGSLAVVIEAVQLISQAITAAGQGIRAAIQDSISGVNAILSTAVSGINDVVGVFGQHINAPRISVPSLTALENITLPHEIQDGLVKLNATLPTLQELKQKMDALIETPFEEMKREVNATLSNFQFNHSVLPVPEMQNVSFCDRIDTSPIDDLGEALKGVAKWGLVLLALVSIVVMLIGVAWEWCKWQREVKAVERTTAVWLAQHPNAHSIVETKEDEETSDILRTENLMSLLSISRHPLISSLTLTLCDRVGIRTRRAQDRLSWLLAFLTHPASLACLFTGLLGLFSVLLQAFLLHRMTSHYTTSINTSLSHLTSDVVNLVNDHTRNASYAFSSSANSVILQVESELNSHVFTWVNTTTFTMNSTLNQFLDGITDALATTFGGTPFNAPLQTFVQCIIGQKVRGIEKALTWIHDNAYVNFSMVPPDVLMLKGEQQEAVLRPVREAMLGSGGDDDGGMVGHVVQRYLRHLQQEKIMFGVLVGVYVLILLIGLAVVGYATVADRRIQPGDDGGKREKEDSEQVEEKLRSSLQAPPNTGWWPHFRKPNISAFGRVSPFTTSKPLTPPTVTKDLAPAPRRTSIAHSSRSNRTHVTKESISYPFRIHQQTVPPTASSPRVRQPTPLRYATHADRNTVLSVRQDHHGPAQEGQLRSSWLSFLATLSTDEGSRLRQGMLVEESAEDRFQRLFGCSPAPSPTASRFPSHLHLSTPPEAGSSKGSRDEGEDDEAKTGGTKFRETLDLRPMQDWIGSKSPLPPSVDRSGDAGKEACGASEVPLTRSSNQQEVALSKHANDTSYAFATAPGSQARLQQQQQPRANSDRSISFYAW